jgi:hypothetical protein
MAFPCITKFRGDKKGVNAQRKNTCTPQNLTLVNSIIKEESVDDHKKIFKKSVSKISSELSSFEKTSRHVR